MTVIETTLGDRSWQGSALRWWAIAVFWIAGTSCSVTIAVMWDGFKTSGQPFERMLQEMERDANPEAATMAVQRRILDAVHRIKARGARDDRAAEIARNALHFLREELDR